MCIKSLISFTVCIDGINHNRLLGGSSNYGHCDTVDIENGQKRPAVRYDEIRGAVEDATSLMMDEASAFEGDVQRIVTDVITPRGTKAQHSSTAMSYNPTLWTMKIWTIIIIFVIIMTIESSS